MKCVKFCVAILYMVAVTPEVGGESPQIDPQREAARIQEREQERQRARQEQFDRSNVKPPSGLPATAPPETSVSGGACVAITSAEIDGMKRYRRHIFAQALDHLVGDCVSIDQINAALRTITNRYVSDGYVTSRAVVGPQNLRSGKLIITVFEGMLSGIRSEEDGYGAGEIALAFPAIKDRLLNLRDIEQGVDQLARLESFAPDIDIEPGAQPATSMLLVRRRRAGNPIRPSLSISNDGSRSTGRLQSTVALDLDSPLGFADLWSLYYARGPGNRPDRRNEAYGLFVSLPYGRWTFKGAAGRYTFRSMINGNGLSFGNTGVTWNGSITADRLLYRDAKTKFSLSGSLAIIDTINRIQGIRLSTSSYRLVTGAIEGRVQRYLGSGVLNFGLSFSRGLGILGAQTVFTGPGGPSRIFSKLEVDFGYQARAAVLGIPLVYSGLVRAQAALDPVFPAERFSLGGNSTVRGFRNDGISGRTGITLRQQVGFNLIDLFSQSRDIRTRVSAFVAHDIGGIAPRKGDAFERGLIQSSVVGLRAQNSRVQTEVALALPLSSAAFINHPNAELSVSLRLAL